MSKNYFRAKDIETEKWVVGFYVCLNGHKHRIYNGYAETDCDDYYPDFYDVIPETVVQFTGEYDLYNKEVCEHDIVRKFVDGKELKGVVEYSDGAFGVRFADGSGQLLCFFVNGCEIIGNAYDTLKEFKSK
jgi:hypothetical protein